MHTTCRRASVMPQVCNPHCFTIGGGWTFSITPAPTVCRVTTDVRYPYKPTGHAPISPSPRTRYSAHWRIFISGLASTRQYQPHSVVGPLFTLHASSFPSPAFVRTVNLAFFCARCVSVGPSFRPHLSRGARERSDGLAGLGGAASGGRGLLSRGLSASPAVSGSVDTVCYHLGRLVAEGEVCVCVCVERFAIQVS